jgi:hypothetical protein
MHTEPSKFHWNYRLTNTSPAGRHIIMFRIGVGYWPCLHAPFLHIAFGKHILEVWYGLPSYKYGLPSYKTKCQAGGSSANALKPFRGAFDQVTSIFYPRRKSKRTTKRSI